MRSERPLLYTAQDLAWLKALNNVATGRPFLDDVERFGMIRDPADPNGLPIGLSASTPADSPFPASGR